MSWQAVVVHPILLLQRGAGAFPAMVTAAALFLCDCSKMTRVLLIMVILVKAGLQPLLCLAKMDAFLLGVMRFLDLAAVALDVCGALLAFLTTVLTLGDRPALLRYEDEFAISVATSAHAVALEA